ncbi:MAG: helix-turn-helix transcriptional regulator [Ruminococcaceae bacterium]|nr:helix-turn-helix transcriptional regulator [Oscillospiraceae bacterium]
MDQVKIGKFIADCRKKQNLTQLQLAERLHITDRAVSKWENGRSMPDISLIPELCGILHVTINDLFSGEVIDMDHYNEKLEKNLLDVAKAKAEADRRLLRLEWVMCISAIICMLGMCMVAAYLPMKDWLRVVLIIVGFVPFLLVLPYAIKIEQTAGYYVCAKCGHRYVPTFHSVLWSMHAGRTRYMKCPHCHQKSWQKKVLTKD